VWSTEPSLCGTKISGIVLVAWRCKVSRVTWRLAVQLKMCLRKNIEQKFNHQGFVNEELNSMVILTRFGLTRFPALPCWWQEGTAQSSPSGTDLYYCRIMDDCHLCFLSFPTLGGSRLLVNWKWPLDFTGVDFACHCNQVDVFLKLKFSWRVLRVSTIVSEPKWTPSLRGMVPIMERTQVGIALVLGIL